MVSFGDVGGMVYADISIEGRNGLYIIRNEALIGHRYRDKVLKPIVIPLVAAIGDDFMFDIVVKECKPLARGTIFWARHRSKRSFAIDSSTKEFSGRFSQFKELSETLKFIMSPDVTSFDKLNLPQFDWLEIEEFERQLIDF
ncbi:uncharacterized protein TNCV_626561 [Trichonephila clavipes]|nr:uncharacterized protein TNCV_626561 [Trichonephila clavipes]